MTKIYTSADQLIGKTPLLELTHLEKALGLEAKLVAKLEYFNPSSLQSSNTSIPQEASRTVSLRRSSRTQKLPADLRQEA